MDGVCCVLYWGKNKTKQNKTKQNKNRVSIVYLFLFTVFLIIFFNPLMVGSLFGSDYLQIAIQLKGICIVFFNQIKLTWWPGAGAGAGAGVVPFLLVCLQI